MSFEPDYRQHEKDPLWQMGQQGQQQQAQRAQQILQGWANKEQYYQGVLLNFIVAKIPHAIFKFLWQYARSVSYVYILSSFALLLAWVAFYIGWGWQRHAGGFSHLDAGPYVAVFIILTIAALFVFAACVSVGWGFISMTWAGQMLALFYVYSWGVWFIHAYVASDFTFGGVAQAWLYCLLPSIAIEAAVDAWKRRKAGQPLVSPI